MARPKTYTEENLAEFRALVLGGLSAQDAEKALGIGSSVLRAALKREHGLSISDLRTQALADAPPPPKNARTALRTRSPRLPTTSTRIGRPRKDYSMTCPICKEVFETKNVRRKYCSLKCVAKAPKKRAPSKRVVLRKNCENCGATFQTRRSEQKYCGNECRRLRTSADKTRLHARLCPTCDTLFAPKSRDQQFCSQDCAYKGKSGTARARGSIGLSAGKRVKYESSYELAFLLFCKDHPKVYRKVARCDFTIPYTCKGKQHLYYPDFVAVDEGGTRLLIEVKSTAVIAYDPIRVKAKKEHAQEWCAKNGYLYEFLTDADDKFRTMCDYVSKNYDFANVLSTGASYRDSVPLRICQWCSGKIAFGRLSLKNYLKRDYCSPNCKSKHRFARKSKACAGCKVRFIGAKEQKYHNKECYTLSQIKLQPTICVICGKRYTPTSSKQQTCGHKCGVEFRTQTRIRKGSYRRPEDRNRLCKQCGITFPSNGTTRKYCSRDCYLLARRGHDYNICPVCGTEFYNYTGKLRTCSKACGQHQRNKDEQMTLNLP